MYFIMQKKNSRNLKEAFDYYIDTDEIPGKRFRGLILYLLNPV